MGKRGIVILIVVAFGLLLFLPLQKKGEAHEVLGPGEEVIKEAQIGDGELIIEGGDIGKEKCSDALSIPVPVDLDKVTSVLYPGQYRGQDQYKPHGGFRFDNSKPGDITVRAPFDARIRSGSRYLESGNLQYLFEFETECGIRFRFDHLVDLSPKLATVAQGFREATEGDSRTTFVEGVSIMAGEVLATSVGVPGNVFVDFGVYDMNEPNEVSLDPSWKAASYGPQAIHGICWLDYIMPLEDQVKIKDLPGSGSEGKMSDYCSSSAYNLA